MSRARLSSRRWWLTRQVMVMAAYALSNLHVTGQPLDTPAIYAASHVDDGDALAVFAALRKVPLAVVASQRLFTNPVTGMFITVRDGIPVNLRSNAGGGARDRVAQGRQVLAATVAAIHSGRSTLIYPEAQFTAEPDGSVGRLKTGLIHMARAADVPIVPVVHTGTEHIFAYSGTEHRFVHRAARMARHGSSAVVRRPEVHVAVGAPIEREVIESGTANEATRRVRQIMNANLADLRSATALPPPHPRKALGP